MFNITSLKRCANLKCNNFFVPYTNKQLYCSPECYIRKNEKITDYPIFKCPKCGIEKELDFYPKLSPKKWNEYKCNYCGYKICSDYEEILEIKIKLKTEIQQYE